MDHRCAVHQVVVLLGHSFSFAKVFGVDVVTFLHTTASYKVLLRVIGTESASS